MQTVPQWMFDLAKEYGAPDNDYMRWMNGPFRINGSACVTDGHFLLALRCANVDELTSPDESRVKSIAKLLKPEPAKALNFEELKKWASAPPPKCELCQGKGTRPCSTCKGNREREVECDDCRDWHFCKCQDCTDGTEECQCKSPYDPALFFGVPVNRWLLNKAIKNLEGDSANYLTNGRQQPIHIAAKDWHVVVMPVRDERKDLPAFATERDSQGQGTPVTELASGNVETKS